MRTIRQIDNSMLRGIGITPTASYASRLMTGDDIKFLVVEDDESPIIAAAGTVEAIEEHGWYSDATVLCFDGSRQTLRIYRDGPPEWGTVECRVLRRINEPLQPSKGRL